MNQVTLQYPDKISTEIYWNHVKDRFFHGLSPIMKANLRTEFQSGSDYYKLLDIARKIEAENMSTDSVNETSKSTHSKGKPKVSAITVDSATAQQLSQLQGAVKGLTNLVKVQTAFSSNYYAGCFCLVCWFSCSFVSEACACFGEWL